MKCKRIQEMMGPYLYGDLTPDEMREVRVHTQDCAACREDLASRGQAVSSIRNGAPQLSDEDKQSITWAVKGAIKHAELARKRPGFNWAPAVAVSIVLVAGLAVGAALTLHSTSPPPGDQASAPGKKAPSAIVTVREEPTAPPPNVQQANEPGQEDSSAKPTVRRRNRSRFDGIAQMARRGVTFGVTSRNNGKTEHERSFQQDEPVSVAPDDASRKTSPSGSGVKLPKPSDRNNAQTNTQGTGDSGKGTHNTNETTADVVQETGARE